MCYKSKETSRCEIVHKLMCCQIGNTLIYREVSHNLTSCTVDHKLANVDRNEGFFTVELLMLILCAVRFTINIICGVTWIISSNFEADKIPQFITNYKEKSSFQCA